MVGDGAAIGKDSEMTMREMFDDGVGAFLDQFGTLEATSVLATRPRWHRSWEWVRGAWRRSA